MTITARKASKVAIEERLEEVQLQVMDIKRRYFALRAFVDALDVATRGKPFRIHNDVLWLMLLDCRDMLVVHLASWCRSAYGRGGLFAQLQANNVSDLRRRKRARASDDPELERLTREAQDAAYGRLFPGVDPTHVQPKDIAALKDRFADETSLVVNDRDDNRAHA